MKRYAAWDLEVSPESRGILPGYLKTLQSNLRHLIWRMGMTLEGDLPPQKRSIGEFSGAFDDLLRCMDRALRGLREQKAEPPAMTDPRREADRRNPAVDTPPKRDACRVDGYDDPIGALNRESFIFRALVELYAAFAQGKRCYLAIAGPDHFKDFNDRYGRPAGDKALGHVAKIISAQLRKTDFMGRWGGEAFALFFQEMDLDACRVVYERILQTLTFTPLNLGEKPVYITASIGVTVADPDEFDINAENFRFLTDGTEILEKLAGRAEKALYEARRTGRNWMVSFYEQLTIKNEQ
jgi:diguanylate cyclase (GGDEF)-like protein